MLLKKQDMENILYIVQDMVLDLDIHEYPNINSRSDVIIENNMVFTVEPGIYLNDKFGVRIEDTVVMKKGKAEIL